MDDAKKIRGLLFDFDGVLANTMRDHFIAWNWALKGYNASIAGEAFYPLEGMPVPVMAREICNSSGVSGEFAEELSRLKDHYYLTNHQFSFYTGVEKCVFALHAKGVPMAIVSGGRGERIRASTSKDFLNKFAAIITAESTPRGKPYPEAYLKGAECIGVPANECVVVENAPLGIQAAKSAGAYCIAITSTMPRVMLTGADEIVDSFADFTQTPMIRTLLGSM